MSDYKALFIPEAKRTDPDTEAQLFNRGSGNWSIYVDDAFEKHLKELYLGKTTKLWLGASGMPKLSRENWNSPYGIKKKQAQHNI